MYLGDDDGRLGRRAAHVEPLTGAKGAGGAALQIVARPRAGKGPHHARAQVLAPAAAGGGQAAAAARGRERLARVARLRVAALLRHRLAAPTFGGQTLAVVHRAPVAGHAGHRPGLAPAAALG